MSAVFVLEVEIVTGSHIPSNLNKKGHYAEIERILKHPTSKLTVKKVEIHGGLSEEQIKEMKGR